MKPAFTRSEATRVAAALGELGFTRAALLVASDRANRYFMVAEHGLRGIGESSARAAVEPLLPGSKAEFLAENPAAHIVPLYLRDSRPAAP